MSAPKRRRGGLGLAAPRHEPEEQAEHASRRCERSCQAEHHRKYENQNLHIRLEPGSGIQRTLAPIAQRCPNISARTAPNKTVVETPPSSALHGGICVLAGTGRVQAHTFFQFLASTSGPDLGQVSQVALDELS